MALEERTHQVMKDTRTQRNVCSETEFNLEDSRSYYIAIVFMASILCGSKEDHTNLHAILDQLLEVCEFPSQVKRRMTGKACRVDKFAILGFCISFLCRYWNQSMNLVECLLYCTIEVPASKCTVGSQIFYEN